MCLRQVQQRQLMSGRHMASPLTALSPLHYIATQVISGQSVSIIPKYVFIWPLDTCYKEMLGEYLDGWKEGRKERRGCMDGQMDWQMGKRREKS